MCGRYSLSAPHNQIHHMVDYPDIDVSEVEWIDEDNFNPRYNIAPRSNAPVIRRQSPDDSNLVIHTMKWGVVPHWSKHADLSLNTINARAENLVESSGMWTSMKNQKRCVVVCDGYFEWLKKGKDRLPHFIRRKDRKFMILAGLYDSALLEGAQAPLWTFTIVTTDAAPSFLWLHDRQPVILSSTADFEAWLDTSKGWHAGLADILKARDGAELECFPVPKEVGRVGTNSASFIQPVSQRKDGIEAMFAKQAAKGKRATAASSSKPSPSSPSNLDPQSSNAKAAPAAPSTSIAKDGKTPKRAIEIDTSPSSSPSPSQHSIKRQKYDHLREGKGKRTMEGEADGSPAKKLVKRSDSSTRDLENDSDKCGKAQFGDDEERRAHAEEASSGKPTAQSRTRGNVNTSGPSTHMPKSKRGAEDPGTAKVTKITAFFPSSDSRIARGPPAI